MLWLAGSAAALPGVLGYRLLLAGESLVGQQWSEVDATTPYRSAHPSIQLVMAGSGAIEVDGTWHALRPGAIVVVPGHRWLRRRGGPGLRLRWANFAIEPGSADVAVSACSGPVTAGPADAPALAGGLLAALELQRGVAAPAVAARVLAGLATAVALLAAAAGHPPARAAPAVERARAFLDGAYRSVPSLAVVARAAGRSPNHLHQAFRAAYGCTPAAYAERLRLRDAQLLLADPDLPIAEIARRCGYTDPFHFSRVVRRACGASPRQLRRRLGGG